MNELRQTKEYQLKDGRKSFDPEFNDLAQKVLSDQGGEYTVPHKGAEPIPEEIKNIQKEHYMEPVKRIMAQQIDEEMDPSKYDGDVYPEDRKYITNAYHKQHIEPEITLNQQMQEIAEIVVPTIHDVIFNEIIEVMDNYDELNWGYFIQDDAPTALIDACMDHKTEIHYEIFQLVLQKLK